MTQKFIGEVEGFSTKPFMEAAETLARADEPERALAILENLPAYYREHLPAEVLQLRHEILFSLITPHGYATVDFDSDIGVEKSVQCVKNLLRGRKVLEQVEAFNKDGKVPHIVDVGPGEYWLPIGLYQLGFRFTYHDVSLLQRTAKQARELLPPELFKDAYPDAPKIFVAYELIEHLPQPRELAVEMVRHCGRPADYIFISTPMYTFHAPLDKDWKKLYGQAHLRAYTPQEFFTAVSSVFPGYSWELESDQIMVLKGTKNG